MSVLGEKLGEISGRITSVTMTTAGMVVTEEAGAMKEFVGAQATVTFGPAIDAAGETGPVTLRGVVFETAGESVPFTGSGVWRKVGPQQWVVRNINLYPRPLAGGAQRFFVEDEYDLATQTTKVTAYALD